MYGSSKDTAQTPNPQANKNHKNKDIKKKQNMKIAKIQINNQNFNLICIKIARIKKQLEQTCNDFVSNLELDNNKILPNEIAQCKAKIDGFAHYLVDLGLGLAGKI